MSPNKITFKDMSKHSTQARSNLSKNSEVKDIFNNDFNVHEKLSFEIDRNQLTQKTSLNNEKK